MELKVTMADVLFVRDVMRGDAQKLHYNGEDVTLFWSGGVDSTFMLLWLLAKGYKVHTIYCAVENNRFKVKREQWARENIRGWLYQNMNSLCDKWVYKSTPLSTIDARTGGFRSCLAQAPLWLLNTQFTGVPHDYVMAYVNGDDALNWIPAFNKIIEGYNMLNDSGTPDIQMHYPMTTMKKNWFFDSMKPIHKFLTWCEMPRLRINCPCAACSRHRFELPR